MLAAWAATASPARAHGSFWDDDGIAYHEGAIEAIADTGVTAGCNPPLQDRYCPDRRVPRVHMAIFLYRALDLEPTDRDYFTDDDDSKYETQINAIAKAGLTNGCRDGTTYCPYRTVTRGQTASFLARAFDVEPSERDFFTDDDGSSHEDNINAIAAAGITEGCDRDGTKYCPEDATPRDEMASFLQRAMGLEFRDPTTGEPVRIFTYELGTEGSPDRGSFEIFGTRAHQALHGEGGWNLDDRIFFRAVKSGGDFRLWLSDDDAVGDKAPACSDDWSCTVGDDLYINDENFADPPYHWDHRSVAAYQRYVINHEVGHWVNFDPKSHYNDPAYCEDVNGDGTPEAPVMMQQSKPSVMDGNGCATNVWPLPFEIDCAEEARLPSQYWQDQGAECPH